MNLENIDNLKILNILYVEDDEVIRELFSKVLKKVFTNVTVASNGVEGLDKFKKHEYKYDFIVTDIIMPEMNGLDMIAEVMKIEPNIPCILTTAHGELDYFMRANEMGIYRYIQKPLDINELFEAMQDFQSGLEVKKIDL
jgi:DNA-binding NtrC family response regulator